MTNKPLSARSNWKNPVNKKLSVLLVQKEKLQSEIEEMMSVYIDKKKLLVAIKKQGKEFVKFFSQRL